MNIQIIYERVVYIPNIGIVWCFPKGFFSIKMKINYWGLCGYHKFLTAYLLLDLNITIINSFQLSSVYGEVKVFENVAQLIKHKLSMISHSSSHQTDPHRSVQLVAPSFLYIKGQLQRSPFRRQSFDRHLQFPVLQSQQICGLWHIDPSLQKSGSKRQGIITGQKCQTKCCIETIWGKNAWQKGLFYT